MQDPEAPRSSRERFLHFLERRRGAEELPYYRRLFDLVQGAEVQGQEILRRALGTLSPLCPECGELCPEYEVRVRDAFLARAMELGKRVTQGAALYLSAREYGVTIPGEILAEFYPAWEELAILYAMAEPGAEAPDNEDEDEGDEDEEDRG